MSDFSTNIVPLASYNLKVIPGIPTLAIDEEFPVAIRLTMAALDPTDPEGSEPSTLKIIKRPHDFPEDGILFDSEEEDDEEDEDEEEEEEPKEEKKVSKKSSKKSKKEESDEEMKEEDEEEEEEDEDDEDDYSFEIEEFVLCTLSPKTSYQQTLDLVITADEDVMFEVSGSYPIHLTGNYIDHPYDGESSDDYDDYDFDSEDEDDEDDLDSDDYDLSPDSDEVLSDSRVEELSDDDDESEPEPEPKKKASSKKDTKKRAAEQQQEEEEKSSKKQKKAVEFKKDLEQGPSGSTSKKPSTKKLEGGVTVEDRTIGEGPTAKNGTKVGVRYIGKLADGKVFDSNTKGKPFYFNLGKGEVIKGWEIGVAGMQVKGERRIVIPPGMAYGKQALPGIPKNSELTFDVKLVNIK